MKQTEKALHFQLELVVFLVWSWWQPIFHWLLHYFSFFQSTISVFSYTSWKNKFMLTLSQHKLRKLLPKKLLLFFYNPDLTISYTNFSGNINFITGDCFHGWHEMRLPSISVVYRTLYLRYIWSMPTSRNIVYHEADIAIQL